MLRLIALCLLSYTVSDTFAMCSMLSTNLDEARIQLAGLPWRMTVLMRESMRTVRKVRLMTSLPQRWIAAASGAIAIRRLVGSDSKSARRSVRPAVQ